MPLTYADYYYVEALLRYKKDILKEKVGVEIENNNMKKRLLILCLACLGDD